ncbi:hypothetical protein J5J10_14115 [Ciceribacter sp. L1K23]|uniref:hypothetical protein n=1 Tax=Ciceribacter sp. L1K23 TaxID=2820276 RepID=UPI001B8412C7|nr:hypothetical protein [Ciceribacter sp. L1K23]MBR0556819.1 hypothetical protein [Ciceribacter sp. L1K23]
MILVAILAVLGMGAISASAYFIVAPGMRRLPMQWSVSGRVNWTAPRLVALSLTPLLISAIMLLVIALETEFAERDIALLILSVVGPVVHLLHIALIGRQTRNLS